MKPRWIAPSLIVPLALVALAAPLLGAGGTAALDGHARFVRDDGSFVFPGEDVRDGLVHLGSWFVPQGDARGFHHVYTQPQAVAAYRATGAFPDGTVLVKEIRRFARGSYTTGADVASATAPVQWFLMVKDTRQRHPDHPLWREGWGWALFQADAPGENVAKSFEADCQGCHLPARETDWVYVQGYPRLGAR